MGKTGGGFASGSTHSYHPDLLITSSARPFIFVSFEYRLGQFGFLGQFSTVCFDIDSFSSSFKEEARYMIMELSTLVFLIRYSTTQSTYIQKAVLLTHPREQHLNGSKDIFITLAVILGYLICSSYTIMISTSCLMFFLENSQVTIWGQSAGAGSIMFHVSCTCLSRDLN